MSRPTATAARSTSREKPGGDNGAPGWRDQSKVRICHGLAFLEKLSGVTVAGVRASPLAKLSADPS
jgi:hypothetical protein